MEENHANDPLSQLAEDRLDGIDAISKFIGTTRRKGFYLASKGLIPGVFKEGRSWIGLKSEIAAGYKARASGKAA